mmetsp:Transcript_98122/g.274066  ORF Transcript_98122/g.274066 Transcript_98122/m.274066 type:complete len:200 (-) Transcript_98122:17-616(-)
MAPAICETMMRTALAVMKPLRAGRDRKRTRKASLHMPISANIMPTSAVSMAPTCVRYSTSLAQPEPEGAVYWTSCSPVRSATRPPVPTDECTQVPKIAYRAGGNMQLYGPETSATLHRSAWASDWATRMQPSVAAPARSLGVFSLHAYAGSHSSTGTYLTSTSRQLPRLAESRYARLPLLTSGASSSGKKSWEDDSISP